MTPVDSTYVKEVTRKSGSNFYLSFFSLPKEKREAITAVYAFCREADDAVDDPGDQDPRVLLADWRAEIARTYDGHPARPLTRALTPAIERFSLTRTYFDGILTGCEMDLTTARYATFQDLYAYCYHVAGEVGLLCMEIFGFRSERMKDYAVKLGLAFQLTNILRDVATDAKNGRIYIPQEDLKRFGVDEGWLLKKSSSPTVTGGGSMDSPPAAAGNDELAGFRALMKYQSARAWNFYREAAALPTPAERPAICAAEIMRAVYADVLKRIEARGFDVFGPRVRVPTLRKLALVANAWWSCR